MTKPSNSDDDTAMAPVRRTRLAIAREKLEGQPPTRKLRVRTSKPVDATKRIVSTTSLSSPNGQRLKLKLTQPFTRRQPLRAAQQKLKLKTITFSSDSEQEFSEQLSQSAESSPSSASESEDGSSSQSSENDSSRRRGTTKISHECPHLEEVEDDCELERVLETISNFNLSAGQLSGNSIKHSSTSRSTRTAKVRGSFKCSFGDCNHGIESGLVMCVTCGKVFCEDGQNHAQRHQTVTSHPVMLDLNRKECFCFICKRQVQSNDELISGFGKKLISVSSTNQPRISDDRFSEIGTSSKYSDESVSNEPIPRVKKATTKAGIAKRKRTQSTVTAGGKKPIRSKPASKSKEPPTKVAVPPGAMGLSNMGNSCFMNSVVQALSNTEIFRDAVLRDPTMGGAAPTPCTPPHSKSTTESSALSPRYLHTLRTDPENVSLYLEWAQLILVLWQDEESKGSMFEPTSFFTSVARVMPTFGDMEQHDAHEFLRYLCDRLHWECTVTGPARGLRAGSITPPPSISHEENKDTNLSPTNSASGSPEASASDSKDHHHHSSFIKDIFGCTLMNELRCLKCGFLSQKADPCLDLSLDIPGAQSRVFVMRHEEPHAKVQEDDDNDSYDAGSIHMSSSEYETSDEERAEENRATAARNMEANGDGATKKRKSEFDDMVASCRPCRLRDCLNSFTKCERLKDAEHYKCQTCVKNGETESHGATKSLRIKSLPQILCLQLKRFAWSMTSRSKIQRYVQFPLKGLDMTEYCTQPDASDATSSDKSGSSKLFNLYAVIVHHGSGFSSGHYTAYCKNHFSGQWWHFNDSVVAPVDEEVVARCQAYLLFYERAKKE